MNPPDPGLRPAVEQPQGYGGGQPFGPPYQPPAGPPQPYFQGDKKLSVHDIKYYSEFFVYR